MLEIYVHRCTNASVIHCQCVHTVMYWCCGGAIATQGRTLTAHPIGQWVAQEAEQKCVVALSSFKRVAFCAHEVGVFREKCGRKNVKLIGNSFGHCRFYEDIIDAVLVGNEMLLGVCHASGSFGGRSTGNNRAGHPCS